MASRMDRYYKDELVNSGRSTKNKSLYEQIEDLDNYTNIEGVATIEKTNEIDITKVKAMLTNRENYKKQKQFRNFVKPKEEDIPPEDETIEETKNYDINDILNKAKEEVDKGEKNFHSLSNEQYELLKSLNMRGKNSLEKENTQIINKKEEKETNNTRTLVDLTDDIGLLDELKANTMVGDASSIKKIIEEEKQIKNDEDTSKIELDKSFYTSSLGFTQSDFEELKDMNHKIKTGNRFIIVLLITIILLLLVSGILFLILK